MACCRASTTRATSRRTVSSGTRSTESPKMRMAAGRWRTTIRPCAMCPPAAATTVAAPDDRATTAPPLSTAATDVSVLVQPTRTPGRTPPCASVSVVASCRVSPSDQAVSAAGATPIQRTCSAPVMDRTEERMETRAAPADSEPAPHFQARANSDGEVSSAATPRLDAPEGTLLHPVTQRDALFARHFVVGVGAGRLDVAQRADEDHAAPTRLCRVCRPGLPAAGAREQDLHSDPVLRPHVETIHRRREHAVDRPIALLGRGDRAQRALQDGRRGRLPPGGRAVLRGKPGAAAKRRGGQQREHERIPADQYASHRECEER